MFSLLLLLVCPSVFAEECLCDYVGEIPDDEKENVFATHTPDKIAPYVNPLTGDLVLESHDLVVAGGEPLVLSRFYNHQAPYEPRYGCWRYHPEAYLVANLEWEKKECFAAVGRADGAIVKLDRQAIGVCTFQVEGVTHFTPNGQTHPANVHLNYETKGDPKDSLRFEWRGEVVDGRGCRRTFISPVHRWHALVHWRYKTFWKEYNRAYGPNFWTPYQLEIQESQLPNGNILTYTYEVWKDGRNYPRPKLLKSITACNHTRSKELASLHFNYERDLNQNVSAIEVVGSDGRKVTFTQEKIKKHLLLSRCDALHQPATSYQYKKHWIKEIEKPEGRRLTTTYHPDGRVASQEAPLGPKGEMFSIGRYVYHEHATEVFDAEENKTVYRFDDQNRLLATEIYDGEKLYRVDRLFWDLTQGDLLRKTIEDGQGTILRAAEYVYDKNHNPIEERCGIDGEWRTTLRTFSDDGFNVLLSEQKEGGVRTRYHYQPNTNLLTSVFVYDKGVIRKRVFHFYDACAFLVKTVIDDGDTTEIDSLQNVSYRKITEIQPKQDYPCLGLAEVVEEKTIDALGQEVLLHKTVYTYTPSGKIAKEEHYDSQNCFKYSILNCYDAHERLLSTTDALGHDVHYTYDANHNLTATLGPREDQHQEITYDLVNRPIRVAEWRTNGSVWVTEREYNRLGRVVVKRDPSGFETHFRYDVLGRLIQTTYPDGSKTATEYDVCGNVIKERDALGYETQQTYNAFGQVLKISYPDGTEETFSYTAQGLLATHVDKNGALTSYRYDAFEHPIAIQTTTADSQKTKKASYSPFHLLSETDPMGNTIFYTYDYAGRKIKERTAAKERVYTYDTLGRVYSTQEGEISSLEIFDCKGHLLEKRKEYRGVLQFQETYRYDPAGNRTDLIHSKGITHTEYDTDGKPLLIEDALHYQTHFSYPTPLIRITTNPKGIQSIDHYDYGGRVVETCKQNRKGACIQKSAHAYDATGRQIVCTHTIFEGSRPKKACSVRWEYGPMGRLERMIEGETKETNYLYDAQGRLKTVVQPDSITCFARHYDGYGRISRYASYDFDYRYTYDLNDRVLSVYDALARTRTECAYDVHGELIKERLGNGLTLSSTYTSLGRRECLVLPDQTTIHYAYEGIYLHTVSRTPYTHLYKKRDLEGALLSAELPNGLGEITIERDALSRHKRYTSPYYSSFFPDNAFDATGKLVHYRFQDALGKKERSYQYDALDQLISEEGHDYSFDSLFNCIEKDGEKREYNALCQPLSEEYVYDLNGNLLSDGKRFYAYDSQNRLMSQTDAQQHITYTYDPFHRRLTRTLTTPTQTKKERYIWDGENEIGCVDETGKIVQLRVLGEGLGAEIGAAVLYELNDDVYIPIHDHRGSVVAMCSADATHTECYRYTAFGEEETTSTLSPWRFSSKRCDAHLLFFGRRYYNPSCGTWITPDPLGYGDGPNLYAYLHNNPLTQCDPRGLAATPHHPLASLGIPFPQFESIYSNKSYNYSLNTCGYLLPTLPMGMINFQNGMGNSFEQAFQKTATLSQLSGGFNIHGTYNATHSGFIDGCEAFINIVGVATTPTFRLMEMWDTHFDKYPNVPLLQIAHSQGNAQVKNGLERYPKERRDLIIVAAIAPAAFIPKELCMQVHHYVCPSDGVPMIDFPSRYKCNDTIFFVEKDPSLSQSCHDFLNPIYQPHLQKEIDSYIQRLNTHAY